MAAEVDSRRGIRHMRKAQVHAPGMAHRGRRDAVMGAVTPLRRQGAIAELCLDDEGWLPVSHGLHYDDMMVPDCLLWSQMIDAFEASGVERNEKS